MHNHEEQATDSKPEMPTSDQKNLADIPLNNQENEDSNMETQWYQKNPALQKAEIKAMADIHPDAKMGYLPNGRMYWTVRIHPVVCGKRKDWTLLAVYDPDHPQARWGGSVKFYPVKPNYNEMQQLVNQSRVTPKSIPHLLREEENICYMSLIDKENIKAGCHNRELVKTAAAYLRYAMLWINRFELGLIDQISWNIFCKSHQIDTSLGQNGDLNEDTMITSLRTLLFSGENLKVDKSGTIYNEADQQTIKSEKYLIIEG